LLVHKSGLPKEASFVRTVNQSDFLSWFVGKDRLGFDSLKKAEQERLFPTYSDRSQSFHNSEENLQNSKDRH